MKKTKARDIEKAYTVGEFVKKLRRFADALEKGKQFKIQVKNQRINVPKGAIVNIEHESSKTGEEVEFQIKWEK